MTTFDIFKIQLAKMREQIKKKEEEYIRIDAFGLEVIAMSNTGDTLLIHGFDENNLESVLVCPVGHFQAKLTFAPKKQERQPIGFKFTADKETNQIK
jgi:hypothetical protein